MCLVGEPGLEAIVVYLGIDLHRRSSQVSVVDERARKVLARRIDNSPAAFCGLLELGGDLRVVVEATYGWEWLAEFAEGA